MKIKKWLRGVWESVKWIASEAWAVIVRPESKVMLLALCVGLAACDPTPTPTPAPSPTPTAPPTPTPTPAECYPPASDSTGWLEWDTLAPQYVSVVDEAEHILGNVCGIEPEASLEALGAKLRYLGYCAGRVDDAVFIRRTDDKRLWEEMHAVAYERGCWTIQERMYRGVWRHE